MNTKSPAILLICLFISVSLLGQTNTNEYKLFLTGDRKHATKPNQKDIDRLSEQLKALATYYCGVAGSECDVIDTNGTETCELTTALGLKSQCSDKYVSVLKKWFHNDPVVNKMIDQNCFLSISGSNYFSFYEYLNFKQSHDTVRVQYEVGYYSRGSSKTEKFTDIAVLGKNQIRFIKRKLH